MVKNLQKKDIFSLFLWVSFIGILLYGIGFAVWTILYTETGNGDNVEHIRATWLIAYGRMPYRDFFEHHNPLLWYLFSPFIKFVTNQITLLDAAHAIGIIAGIITFFFVYKINSKFFASPLASLISIILLCPPYFFIYCFNFNPDTFMALCLAAGIYFLFEFFSENRDKHLVLAFLFFFLSFMFTQKVLIILGQLGIISLFVFFNQRTNIKQIAWAMLLPLTCFLLFISFLYYHSTLELYWKTNYLFNVEMQNYYGDQKINVVDSERLIFSFALSFLSILIFFRKSSLYFKIVSFLFITEFVQRYFYFSISPYYMLPLMIFSAGLNSVLITKILERNKVKWLAYVFLAVAVFYASVSKNKYLSVRGKNRDFAKFLSRNITPCDYVLNGFLGSQAIIGYNMHYYWALLGHVDIAGASLNIAPTPDMNALVLKYKPKLINSGVYWNNYYRTRGKNVFYQQVSPEIVDKYYLPTPFSEVYILKYEYRKNICKYNGKTWEYVD